jgi:putative ABC transport system permease protein
VVSRVGTFVAAAVGTLLQSPARGWRWPAAWLAIARLRERPGEATAALAGVVASFALAAAMTTMVHSFRVSVVQWLDVVLPSDVYGSLRGASAASGLDPALTPAVEAVDGVRAARWMRVRSLGLDPGRPDVTLLAREIDPDAPHRALPLTGPTAEIDAGCTAVYGSEAMADLYRWSPGARVSLPLGPIGHCFVVGGIWRDYARQHGAIAMPRTDYRALTGDALASDLSITTVDGADPSGVIERLRAVDPALAALEWRSADALRETSLAIFDRSFAATYALEAVAILLGVLGVAAGYAAEALARQREFGVLQHLGLTRPQIARMLAAEGAITVAVGCVVGLALGAALALVLIERVNPVSFHWRMDVVWPVGLLAASAAALVLLAAATAAVVAWHALRQSPARVVRADW